MGLQPLEFSDCYEERPHFRERLRAHEAELEKTNKFIKELLKDGKALVAATDALSAAQHKFARSLGEFSFEFIGDAETDDERCIDESLQEFAAFLHNLEEQRKMMMLNIRETFIKPLEKFRKDQIGAAKEEKKKYDKETEKYYSILEKHVNLSAKKKETLLLEADSQLEQIRQHYYELSLEYVCKVQEIQERRKFEFVEPMLSFFQMLFTFYHQGYELAKDFNHYKTALHLNIQNARNRFEGARSEVEELMNKIKKNPHELTRTTPFTMEGYLYLHEKRTGPFGSSWVKHYCSYKKETKRFTMVQFDQRSGGKIGDEDTFVLKSCTRKKSDATDKRFCFDIEAVGRQGVITMQAITEDDRRQWMEALDGKEPVYLITRSNSRREGNVQLNEMGFNIIKKCIQALETRGLNDQGLYRVVGVSSKVQRLMSLLSDSKVCADLDLDNSLEWETKTITSSLKHYLRNLPEPLMTYNLHEEFISLAKCGSPESRIKPIHSLIHKLPEKNQEMLDLLIKHLANVSNNAKQNLMTIANLGVVFGPTLMRARQETVAAIMDLKFQNIVVEILIENYEKIFRTVPDASVGQSDTSSMPSSNTLTRRTLHGPRHSRPIAVYNVSVDLSKAENPNSGVDNTPSGSMESISSHSSVTTTSSNSNSPPEQARNRVHPGNIDAADCTSSPSLISMASCFNSSPTSLPSFQFPSETASGDKPPNGVPNHKAKAVYSCEAEHYSELSFKVGAIFENVHSSREPGWLEGTLNGKTGLIPENYVEFL
ncbi:rho GTPase-activating protein 10 isoform X1 [Carcharodon carcharias]|uniref:rho GTPase-activating protein 10 isoform X1 n=2 Tax=Carcharodon carcharias TaxID=13397 RepID=UPI001B7DEA11|nr:rho GTPase-activating protein 10 isoform X1 [Carcharodon carcharias]